MALVYKDEILKHISNGDPDRIQTFIFRNMKFVFFPLASIAITDILDK